ncbi:hypothetical protein MnTg02_01390 [bacterium MnTg02]|nr:hypothetical protein MnTg02_01390 [bacterium MnTg02]
MWHIAMPAEEPSTASNSVSLSESTTSPLVPQDSPSTLTTGYRRLVPFPEVRDAGVGSCLPHGRYVNFRMAEVAVPRELFHEILRLIAELRAPPAPA